MQEKCKKFCNIHLKVKKCIFSVIQRYFNHMSMAAEGTGGVEWAEHFFCEFY